MLYKTPFMGQLIEMIRILKMLFARCLLSLTGLDKITWYIQMHLYFRENWVCIKLQKGSAGETNIILTLYRYNNTKYWKEKIYTKTREMNKELEHEKKRKKIKSRRKKKLSEAQHKENIENPS
ncbi:hypothetical protein JTE90_026481 [Oedothorax gibbosus]|uniref:Uncharacterized protein n=1 Tax=Oedothorax gibbosus TaxID=931172 RepID=A0AAV6VQU7_9ARAC|nr:hypothetical protein JTE90_026481 [Oedothorax gibbosus]